MLLNTPIVPIELKEPPLGFLIYIILTRARARGGLSITDYEKDEVFLFVDARSFTVTDDLAYIVFYVFRFLYN